MDARIPVPHLLLDTPSDERDPAVDAGDKLFFVSDFAGDPAIFMVSSYNLWEDGGSFFDGGGALDPYPLGAQTRHIAGGPPAPYPVGGDLAIFFARAEDAGYAVLSSSFYADAPEEGASSAVFVGHSAGGPVFWRGEPVR